MPALLFYSLLELNTLYKILLSLWWRTVLMITCWAGWCNRMGNLVIPKLMEFLLNTATIKTHSYPSLVRFVQVLMRLTAVRTILIMATRARLSAFTIAAIIIQTTKIITLVVLVIIMLLWMQLLRWVVLWEVLWWTKKTERLRWACNYLHMSRLLQLSPMNTLNSIIISALILVLLIPIGFSHMLVLVMGVLEMNKLVVLSKIRRFKKLSLIIISPGVITMKGTKKIGSFTLIILTKISTIQRSSFRWNSFTQMQAMAT